MTTTPLTLMGLALAIGLAGNPLHAQTQRELNESGRHEFEAADAHLNKVYRQILDEYQRDRAFVRRLQAAQRAWVSFRDAHVQALFPAADPRRAYGSVYPLCRWQALTALTSARSDELETWIDGVDETEACAGSRRSARNGIRAPQLTASRSGNRPADTRARVPACRVN
jgi:uncharacterized protein YecT (DUF1311 family)